LREDTLEKAIKTYPNVEDIPSNNIAKLKEIGLDGLQKLM
jgi:hypothetical protein